MAKVALLVVMAVSIASRPASSLEAPRATPQQTSSSSGAPLVLDFDVFRARVEPIFLKKREGLARCYVCHSQGTTFVLQRLSDGRSSWTEEQSRLNLEAVRRLVVPDNPGASRLLAMPLAAEAGGISFHPGGKHWTSQDDPEWQILAAWVRGVK